MKILKNDEVQVVKGKEAGKRGKVDQINPDAQTVRVAGLNQYKKHVKARTPQQTSEIIMITRPLPVANVAVVCPHCNKITRIGYVIEKDKKVRVCRKCDKKL